MNLEQILPALREGRPIRRSMWVGNPRLVRLADPHEERELDGPATLFQIRLGRENLEEAFEDEADAKKALAALKKQNTADWKKYHELDKKLEEHTEMARERVLSEARPVLPEDAAEHLEILETAAPRKDRVNRPMLLARGRDGSIYPYVLQVTDIIASDWQHA